MCSKDEWVRIKVRFTKCLFAQLSKQQFFPPKGFVLPPKEDAQHGASERGLKLAAAFEMLYAVYSSMSTLFFFCTPFWGGGALGDAVPGI